MLVSYKTGVILNFTGEGKQARGYRLSSMNGVELYDQLHLTEGLETIPAIIMSAGLPREQLENEIKQRQLVVLPNPHDLDVLLQTIEQVFASAFQGTVTD